MQALWCLILLHWFTTESIHRLFVESLPAHLTLSLYLSILSLFPTLTVRVLSSPPPWLHCSYVASDSSLLRLLPRYLSPRLPSLLICFQHTRRRHNLFWSNLNSVSPISVLVCPPVSLCSPLCSRFGCSFLQPFSHSHLLCSIHPQTKKPNPDWFRPFVPKHHMLPCFILPAHWATWLNGHLSSSAGCGWQLVHLLLVATWNSLLSPWQWTSKCVPTLRWFFLFRFDWFRNAVVVHATYGTSTWPVAFPSSYEAICVCPFLFLQASTWLI